MCMQYSWNGPVINPKIRLNLAHFKFKISDHLLPVYKFLH